jgi:four helix bundle protein
MFLQLSHTKLDVYKVCKALVIEAYKVTKKFPAEEKYALTMQIRRAATSILLNLAEGSSRKSPSERKRYYEIARGSLIEVDAAFEIAFDLAYFKAAESPEMESLMIRSFQLLTKMIG